MCVSLLLNLVDDRFFNKKIRLFLAILLREMSDANVGMTTSGYGKGRDPFDTVAKSGLTP